jgi:negative regulator of sigma E activity
MKLPAWLRTVTRVASTAALVLLGSQALAQYGNVDRGTTP